MQRFLEVAVFGFVFLPLVPAAVVLWLTRRPVNP